LTFPLTSLLIHKHPISEKNHKLFLTCAMQESILQSLDFDTMKLMLNTSPTTTSKLKEEGLMRIPECLNTSSDSILELLTDQNSS